MNHIPVLKYEPKSRSIFWLWVFFTLRSLCLLRSSVYCFWKNLVLQIIYYFTLHWTICHFADEAPLKVYCHRCSNTVFFMNTAKKEKVLNKYIWKKKSLWEICLLSTQQQELLVQVSMTTWITPRIQVYEMNVWHNIPILLSKIILQF